MNKVTIVILGASGDLARRKLIPALYRLIKRGSLKDFIIVGAAREQTSAQTLCERAKKFIKDPDETHYKTLCKRFFYQQLDFTQQDDFVALEQRVKQLEGEWQLPGNRMIYLAASAEFYCTITQHIATSKLAIKKSEKTKTWNRLVYEKPFGHDLHSAQEINDCIQKYFEEHQIYRIDHFLTKELVSNIALVRFTNCVFEPLWNNRYVDQIQIMVSESIGIEGRGAYYDKYGALADVMQNHVLELLALIAMETPEKLSGNYVRDKRVEVLQDVEPIDGILGQYETYTSQEHVDSQSNTETFAALQLRINNPRWAGVPFYLLTGKCLDEKKTIINIKFKQVDCLLTHSCPVPSNWLTIEVSPEAVFSLSLNVKEPGRSEQVMPIAMEFCHSCLFGEETLYAYEVVLEEVIRGEQSISVRFDEIEAAWNIIDRVRAMKLPVYEYACQTQGPTQLDERFEKKHGMRWRR